MDLIQKLNSLKAERAKHANICAGIVESLGDSGIMPEEQAKAFDAADKTVKEIEANISRLESQIQRARDTEAAAAPATAKKDPSGFESLGENLIAIIRAKTGRGVDPRLRAATGMNEESGADGGYLVQQDFLPLLVRPLWDSGNILSRVRRYTASASSNSVRLPAVNETSRVTGSRFGGLQVYRKKEGSTATASKPDFRTIELKLAKLIGLSYLTDELLEDAPLLQAFLTDAFREEMTVQIEGEVIGGTGVGEMLGITKSPALVTVSKESGQTADTINATNLAKMDARLPGSSDFTAVWLANHDAFPQFPLLSIANQPVWLPPNALQGRPAPTLFGKPVFKSEHCASVGDLTDIILADFSQYLVIEKGGFRTAVSFDFEFDGDEPVMKFVMRNNGAPLWSSAVTPKNGSNALSPFVTLEAR